MCSSDLLLTQVAQMAEFAPDYAGLLAEMLAVLHRVAIAQKVPDAVDNSQGDKELITALAAQISPEDVQLFYQIGLIGQRDLPYAPEPRSGFEMILLRMLSFVPAGEADDPQGSSGQDDASGAQGSSAGGQSVSAGPRADSPVKALLSQINDQPKEPVQGKAKTKRAGRSQPEQSPAARPERPASVQQQQQAVPETPAAAISDAPAEMPSGIHLVRAVVNQTPEPTAPRKPEPTGRSKPEPRPDEPPEI